MKRTALAGAFGGDSFGQLGEKRRVGSNLSVLLIIDQLNNAGGSAGGFIFFFSAHSHTRLRFLKPALCGIADAGFVIENHRNRGRRYVDQLCQFFRRNIHKSSAPVR